MFLGSCALDKKSMIVFAPHPDDETFGCGGTIAKRLSEGYVVLIVVLTDGRYAFSALFGIDAEPTSDELKEIRKAEVRRATEILGVSDKNLLFLDYEDGTLDKNFNEVKGKIIEILAKNTPEEVYYTYVKDIHIDHRITRLLVRDSVRDLGLGTRKYQYSIVRKYARVGPAIDKLFDLFRHNMIRVDISKFLSLKEAALKEFKSEVTTISRKQPRPIMEDIEMFLRGKETFFVDK